MLFAIVPALAAVWALGGSLSALLDRKWKGVWLIWTALAVQIVLFTPLGAGIPDGTVRVVHTVTYLPIIAFLALNRDAGLGLVAAGVSLNFVAIAANGGLMPADAAAQQVFFEDNPTREHSLNTVNESPNLLFLGDTMSLPGWFPYSNAFSIGDMLLAIGIVWAIARVTRRSRGPSPLSGLAASVRTRWRSDGAPSHVGGGIALAAAVGVSLSEGHAVQASTVLISWIGAGALSTARPDVAPRWAAPGALVLAALTAPVVGFPALLVAALGAGMSSGPRACIDAPPDLALGATALGLAVGATMLSYAGVAVALSAAGALAVAGLVGRARGTAKGIEPRRPHTPPSRPARPVVTIAFGAIALGLVAAGALAVSAPLHGMRALGLGPESFGILAGAAVCGTLCGRLMVAALSPDRSASSFGLAFVFAGASVGLLATATMAMTAVAATVVLGMSAGAVTWLIEPFAASTHRVLAAFATGSGTLIGALAGATGTTAGLWAACLQVGLLGGVLMMADVPARLGALRTRPA